MLMQAKHPPVVLIATMSSPAAKDVERTIPSRLCRSPPLPCSGYYDIFPVEQELCGQWPDDAMSIHRYDYYDRQ
ncbi:MAG: hypothetical protein MIO88_00500, partial [Methanoregulaceae archaeon]|nr:hypothetical protein [Methanoregulaceae archaeon]